VEAADARSRLLELLRRLSFERRRVVLASGRESDFFIDCKQAVLTAEGHALVGRLMLDAIVAFAEKGAPAAAVAGVELGGCPLASAVSLTSFQAGTPLDAVYVRKESKDHGSRRLLEGDGRLAKGAAVALVEDVVTTGGSTLRAAEKLRDAGYAIAGVVALVDRLEGGREALLAAGLPVTSLYTRADFIP
jgi:orotate phosphoribosyltransferase